MTDKLIEAVIGNGPLVAALSIAYWWLTPKVLKATLSNGGGAIIRGHIDAANAAQSEKTHAAIKAQLAEHEEREFRQYGSLGEAVALVRERLAGIEGRLADHVTATGRA